MKNVLTEFKLMLERGQDFNLHSLLADVPADQREFCLLKLIEMEFNFYRDKGWTYSLARQEEFPEARQRILEIINQVPVDSRNFRKDARKLHFAECKYLVEPWNFAEGGQGALYRATDSVLGDRQVAVKVLKNPADANRFKLEAEITAMLDHPGIAAVYAYSLEGKHLEPSGAAANGRPFYAMRLVGGKPLEDCISDYHNARHARRIGLSHDPKFLALIQSLVSACHTIAYAHSVGVLHCDIKPQNIMCGDFGATVVLDWGCAASTPGDTKLTAGAHVNKKNIQWSNTSNYTTAYASPEQIAKEKFGQQTDVYSLGATLYQIISGKAPVDANDYAERRAQDRIGNVRSQQPACSKRLDSICVRAMKTRPEDRYSGPEQLAHDLQNWMRGEPIVAKPDNVMDKAFRLANRHRLATSLVMMLLALLLGGYYLSNRAKVERLRLAADLDSGLSLIEDICAPLANGELQNPAELSAIASKVKQHCDENLADNEKMREPIQLGRLYNMRSLTNYFYENYNLVPPVDEVDNRPEAQLNHDGSTVDLMERAVVDSSLAVENFEKALQQSSGKPANTIKRLAGSSLFLARLKFKQSQLNLQDQTDDLNLAKTAADNAIKWLLTLSNEKNVEMSEFELAEAYQLLGEIHLSLADQPVSNGDHQPDHYQTSADSFKKCNEILESMDPGRDTPRRLRAQGRGYGYLGDVQKEQGLFPDAFQSYTMSLGFRKELFKQMGQQTAENLLQLARGHGNFARTLCDFGALPEVDGQPVQISAAEIQRVIDTHLGSKSNESKLGTEQVDGSAAQPIEEEQGLELTPAIEIFERLSKLGEKSSITEYASNLNLAGELYFNIAKLSSDPERKSAIEKCLEYANSAAKIYRNRPKEDRSVATGLVYSNMLLMQAKLLDDPNLDVMTMPEVREIDRRTDRDSNPNRSRDQLFMRCVGRAAEKDQDDMVKKSLEELVKQNFNHDWRLKQHLGTDYFEVFDALRKSTLDNSSH